MDLRTLVDITADELVNRMESSRSLGVFAKHRAKFEGWLKVELVDILIRQGHDAVPEHDRIDVCFGGEYEGIAIELKAVNTNYRDGIAENKVRPITKNIQGVLDDIEKHWKNNFPHKFVIFVAFPLDVTHAKWKSHLKIIEEQLGAPCWRPRYFTFTSGVGGSLYYGKVSTDPKRKLEWLRTEIAKGDADLRAGRFSDGPTAMIRIRERLFARKQREYDDRR
jgi:hypothetical protein